MWLVGVGGELCLPEGFPSGSAVGGGAGGAVAVVDVEPGGGESYGHVLVEQLPGEGVCGCGGDQVHRCPDDADPDRFPCQGGTLRDE